MPNRLRFWCCWMIGGIGGGLIMGAWWLAIVVFVYLIGIEFLLHWLKNK